MSERKDENGKTDETEEVENRLASIFGEEDESPDRDPPIKLDKTGALADRPKLQPKKPYAREGAPASESEAVGSLDPEDRPGVPRKATLPPPIGSLRPAGFEAAEPKPPDDEVKIPGASFLFGEEKEEREVPAFRIDRYPVRNREYEVFVKATSHRPPLYWVDGKMPGELADHPVVGVDYYDALAYARWKGKDLPYEDEWERAARGKDGRTYPWGDEVELGQANTARLGLKMTMPTGWYEMNVSPDGVWDSMGNVWEITHSPAPGGGIVVRGGSWFDFVLYAKTWFRFASRPEARNGTIGFRCVRRMKPRPDVEREVTLEDVEAALEARRGPQPKVDVSTFSPERRDLVPDYRRLGQLMSEREEEEAEARDAALIGRAPVGGDKPLRAPVKATPPPRLRPPPKPKPKPTPKPTQRPDPAPAKRPETKPAPPRPKPAPPAPPTPSPAATPAPVVAGEVEEREGLGGLGLWLAAGAALALVAALVVGLFMQKRDAPEPVTPPVAELPPDAPLPEAAPPAVEARRLVPLPPETDPRDDQAPLWIQGDDAERLRSLKTGVWLVVFADVPGPDGDQTVVTANAYHRALRDTAASLALVLPRAYFEADDGSLLGEEARRQRLRDLGALTDVTVVLDPSTSPPYGSRLRAAYRVEPAQAALILVDGRRKSRTAPPFGGFTEATLDGLAHRAVMTASK